MTTADPVLRLGHPAARWWRARSAHAQVFVASQVNGTWQTAIEVPGTAALNQGGSASIASVSRATVGNCSAGGTYTDGFLLGQAFVDTET